MDEEMNRPLSQLEAGRVKTEIYNKHNKKILYRELYGFTPKQIGSRLGIRASEVAEMAGRGAYDEPKGIRA
jgi:DNA-directed RNA polymerase specialized sigma24 family protein